MSSTKKKIRVSRPKYDSSGNLIPHKSSNFHDSSVIDSGESFLNLRYPSRNESAQLTDFTFSTGENEKIRQKTEKKVQRKNRVASTPIDDVSEVFYHNSKISEPPLVSKYIDTEKNNDDSDIISSDDNEPKSLASSFANYDINSVSFGSASVIPVPKEKEELRDPFVVFEEKTTVSLYPRKELKPVSLKDIFSKVSTPIEEIEVEQIELPAETELDDDDMARVEIPSVLPEDIKPKTSEKLHRPKLVSNKSVLKCNEGIFIEISDTDASLMEVSGNNIPSSASIIEIVDNDYTTIEELVSTIPENGEFVEVSQEDESALEFVYVTDQSFIDDSSKIMAIEEYEEDDYDDLIAEEEATELDQPGLVYKN